MSTPSGPQQFELQVYDRFDTNDPAAPQGGLQISATIFVTVNWTVAGTELTKEGVEFDAPQWLNAGSGPFVVYEDEIGGAPKPAGAVEWSVVTRTLKAVEKDAANNRYRWSITPVAKLLRKETSTKGLPPQTTEVYSAKPDPLLGAWQPLA